MWTIPFQIIINAHIIANIANMQTNSENIFNILGISNIAFRFDLQQDYNIYHDVTLIVHDYLPRQYAHLLIL